MKEKKLQESKKEGPENPLEQHENESYLQYILRRMVIKFFVKDGGTVNIHIDNFMSGKPPNPPPY